MSHNDANEVAGDPFHSPHSRYQGNLETSMRGSDFIFESVQFLYYKCHKINFKHGGLYIDSREWIKKKKSNNKFERYR